jgi:small conductance mechanosensitive channel
MSVENVLSFALIYGPKILIAALVFFIGKWLAAFCSDLFEKTFLGPKFNRTFSLFIRNAIYYVLLTLVVITALDQLGVRTTTFLAIVGAAGLAIALALQGSLTNLAAGIIIIFTQPFQVGDKIEVLGFSGVVEEIQIFSTILKTGDKKRILIPNIKITTEAITVEAAKKP